MKYRLYVEIAIDNMSFSTDRLYTYGVPEELEQDISRGKRVLVSFGNGNRMLEGLIVNILEDVDVEPSRIKPIQYIVDRERLISDSMLELIGWIRETYIAQYIEVIKTVLPSGIGFKAQKKIVRLKPIEITCDMSVTDRDLIEYLNSRKRVSLSTINKRYKNMEINKTLKRLVDGEYIEIQEDIEQSVRKKYIRYVVSKFKAGDLEGIKETLSARAKKQMELLDILSDKGQIPRSDLLREANTSSSTLNSLKAKDLIEEIDIEENRNPVQSKIERYEKIDLNAKQRQVLEAIDLLSNKKYLLHGVTGSGKTEIYLQLIEGVLEMGKQVIVLVPEISLTPQTMDRFIGRFGDDVAIYHSKLSSGERYDEWRKMASGQVNIVIGTRSAIFAPFKDLGLIIIDEEHEQSYKSSMNPKYNTVEVAEKRTEIEGGVLLIGSATPSVEKYYQAESGLYKLLELSDRANKKPLPNIDLIDMKEELYNGNVSIFSRKLYLEIEKRLQKREQVILFLNSRGHSKFISCRSCGYVVKCDECDVSMTYHSERDMLICHYCGKSKKMFKTCPECSSKYIKYMGIGTQKVEQETKKVFKNARVQRLDLDTTTRKNSYQSILGDFKSGAIDILIGTQMISKGLDFPNVTLVGVIMADTVLNIPDYKSSERTFQLMTQVAGRAGRSDLEGEVIIQTYEPDHYSLENSKNYDYTEFYRNEIMLRRLFRYPPFCKMVDITIYGKDEEDTIETSNRVYNILKKEIDSKDYLRSVELLGPNPASIYRIRHRFRWKILIKAEDRDIGYIRDIIRKKLFLEKIDKKDEIRISVDINPSSIV